MDVRVRGASGALSRVGAGDIVAVLDLHARTSGHRLFPLTPDQVRVPFGVEVVQVTPSTVAMAFENVRDARSAGRARGRRQAGAGLCGGHGDVAIRTPSKSSVRRPR